MKTRLFLILALIPAFTGCELLKDANTVSIDTELTTSIPVDVVASGKKSAEVAAEVTAISFSKSQDLLLSANTDIEPYLEKIKEINLNSLWITINGLTAGQTINSISLEVTGVGTICSHTNITMSNNSFDSMVTVAKLEEVAAKLTSDKKITITISGNASGPMSFSASLNFDTTLIAKVL